MKYSINVYFLFDIILHLPLLYCNNMYNNTDKTAYES